MSKQNKPGAHEHIRVPRYSGSARINHWIVAISFVLLLLSGLSLFHPSLYGLSILFGGGATVRWLHPWIGVVLFFSFLGLFLRFWKANLWKAEDGTWLARLRDVLSAHGFRAGCTTVAGRNDPSADPLALKRIRVSWCDGDGEVRKAIAGCYDWYRWVQRAQGGAAGGHARTGAG